MLSMQHHLAKQRALSPCSMSVDSPHTPAVRWKRQLHSGTSETWLRSIGLENTSVATCPSQQSLRECVLSTISQDPGTSVSEYSIRLPVHHSCKATPWHRASPEGHNAAPSHLRPFWLVTTLYSAPVQYPIPLLHLVRLLVLPPTTRRTHDASRVPLPERSVCTSLRPCTPPLHPLPPPPLALCPPLGVLAHTTSPSTAVSLPFPANLRLSASFPLSSCPSHPPLTLLHLR